jgi:hypothetical protein
MLATLAKSTPVLADDTPVWVTTDAAGNQLAWAHWENTYSGYTRVERATEWQLIHQMYQNDPTLPPADVQKQVVALRATMEAISQSPESEFLNTTQTQLKMLDALSGVFLSNPPGVVGLAVVKAANLLMDTIQQGEKDKISTQNAYLTTVDQASRAAAVEDKQKAIFDSVRTSTNPYEVAAVNGLYLPELNISLHADADAIIGADPQVRSTMETLDAIDASTKKLSTEIHDGVQSIRLDISNLNSAWDQKWTETQDELHNINGSISDLNSKIDAQGKSFADYVADERGRQAEADARVREAQQFQQTIKGLQASISIISTFVGMVNPAAGKAIRAVGTAALSIGVSIATWLGAVGSLASLASPLGLLNTVTMVGGVMGAVQGLFGAFSNAPSELDIVSSKLDGLKQQVSDLQANMNQRFDRLNQTLGQIFEGMNVQFQRLNHQLVSVAADVQLALGKFAGLEL